MEHDSIWIIYQTLLESTDWKMAETIVILPGLPMQFAIVLHRDIVHLFFKVFAPCLVLAFLFKELK